MAYDGLAREVRSCAIASFETLEQNVYIHERLASFCVYLVVCYTCNYCTDTFGGGAYVFLVKVTYHKATITKMPTMTTET